MDEFKALWQDQTAPAELDDPTLQSIDRFQKRSRRHKIALFISLPATTIYLGVMIWLYSEFWFNLGIVVCVGAMGYFLYAFQRLQSMVQPVDSPRKSRAFAEANLKQLQASRQFAKRTFPVYAILLGMGLTISSIGLFARIPFPERWWYHFLYLIVLGGFFALVGWLSRRAFERKFAPLERQLERVLEEGREKSED